MLNYVNSKIDMIHITYYIFIYIIMKVLYIIGKS